MSDKLTFEQAIAGVLSPWFDKDVDLGAGTRIATAKDAAAHAFVAAMNTDDSQRGTVRVLVTSAEEKREIHGYLTAFFADAPQLKQMRLLKKTTPDAFFLTSGVNITIDTNSARLAKNVLAQIVLDPRAADPVATVWLEVDSDDIESVEAACIRHGIDPALAPQVRTIRWMTRSEGKVAPKPHWDEPNPGPPVEHGAHDHTARDHVTPEPDFYALAAAEQRWREACAELERERQNEKLREGYRRISGGFV